MAKKGSTAKKARKVYEKTDAGKAERFKDFANARVPRAIKAMRAVGRLAVGGNYKYSTDEAQKVCAALAAEYNRVKNAFETAGKGKTEALFTL